MPKRVNNNRSRKPPLRVGSSISKQLSNSFNAITRYSGRAFISGPTANGNTFTSVETSLEIANLGAAVISIADTFEYWRMKALRVKQLLYPSTSFAQHGVSFIPLSPADFTAATSFATLCDFPEFNYETQQTACQIRVGRSGLMGSQPLKWLMTNSNEANFTRSAGTITSAISSNAGDTTSFIRYYIEFELEFKGHIDPALNPLYRKREVYLSSTLQNEQYISVPSTPLTVSLSERKEPMAFSLSKPTLRRS